MEEAGARSVQITTDPDTGRPKKTYGTDPAPEHWWVVMVFVLKAKTVFRNLILRRKNSNISI
jgi:hypothetical protein